MSSGLPSKVGRSVQTGLRVRDNALSGSGKGSSSSTDLQKTVPCCYVSCTSSKFRVLGALQFTTNTCGGIKFSSNLT